MNKLESFATGSAGKRAVLAAGALTGLFESVESFLLLPKISKMADGKKPFDTAFGNDREKMQAFLDALSDEGTDLYRHDYLRMDNLYPFIYGSFMTLAMVRWNKKADWKAALPPLLMAFDYVENTCSAKMLDSGTVSKRMARIASTATNCKMLTMIATIDLLAWSLWKDMKH